jgi:hypothetical protein
MGPIPGIEVIGELRDFNTGLGRENFARWLRLKKLP